MKKLTMERPRLGVRLAEAFDDLGLVSVRSGPYHYRLRAAHCTVGQIRDRVRDRFGLRAHTQAFLGGVPVADTEVVQPRQSVMFMHQAGVKG